MIDSTPGEYIFPFVQEDVQQLGQWVIVGVHLSSSMVTLLCPLSQDQTLIKHWL
jgi:hypothetical protein